jgi:hypothetical protein
MGYAVTRIIGWAGLAALDVDQGEERESEPS